MIYEELTPVSDESGLPLIYPKASKNVRWRQFFTHWPLWAIYIAHFSMNWSNYIIMQWLPTYLARNLGANKESISLTAVPFILNSMSGVGKLISLVCTSNREFQIANEHSPFISSICSFSRLSDCWEVVGSIRSSLDDVRRPDRTWHLPHLLLHR